MLYPYAAAFFALACVPLLAAYGDEPRRLTEDGRRKFSPVFVSADELVYVDLAQPELTVLKRLKLSDLSVEPLHPPANTQELEPAFSADGRLCVYLKATGTLSVMLVIHNRQADTRVELPPGAGFSGFRSPAVSPDGKRVIYSFAEGGYQDIFTVDAEAKDRQQLTKNSGMNYWPGYSPDGGRIVFSSTRDGNYEIYTMSADGRDIVRLTDNPFQDIRPRYSPDGRRIAFTSNRDGNFEIYVMNADGSGLRRVTNHPERDDYPAWHPDGKRLVTVAEREGRHDLALVPVD